MSEVELIEKGQKVIYFLSKYCKFFYLQRIAIGAYGIVYKMYNKERNTITAVKVATEVDKFELEEWPKLNHQNVVPVKDILLIDDTTVFFMPMLMGDLMDICCGKEFYEDKYSYDLCRIWFQDILCAMSYIHENGLCHLDLKMNNVFLKHNGHACVGDFSHMTSSEAVPVSFKFKEHYLPPEFTPFFKDLTEIELTSEYVKGDAADMWQLGIFLLDMLLEQKILLEKMSSFPVWNLDIVPFITKVKDDESYLQKSLQNKFTSRHFAKNEVSRCQDIINKLLQFNPENRMTARDALKHGFVSTGWPKSKKDGDSPVLLDSTYRLPQPDGAKDRRTKIGLLKHRGRAERYPPRPRVVPAEGKEGSAGNPPKPSAKDGARDPDKRGGVKSPAKKGGVKRPEKKGGPKSPAKKGSPKSPGKKGGPKRPAKKSGPKSPAKKGSPKSPAKKGSPKSPAKKGGSGSPAKEGHGTSPQKSPVERGAKKKRHKKRLKKLQSAAIQQED